MATNYGQANKYYRKRPDDPRLEDLYGKRKAEIARNRLKAKQRAQPKRDHRDAYRRYINSAKWRAKRQQALQHYGNKCEVCGATDRLQVHHKHYRTLKRERMEDLQVLCRGCHENHHEGEKPGCLDPMTREYRDILGKA